MKLWRLAPHALVLAGGVCIFQATIGGASAPALRPRLEALREAPCTGQAQCTRLALSLGLDPHYSTMPDDALTEACARGDETACAYRLPCDWPPQGSR